jgi:hypothetical protein
MTRDTNCKDAKIRQKPLSWLFCILMSDDDTDYTFSSDSEAHDRYTDYETPDEEKSLDGLLKKMKSTRHELKFYIECSGLSCQDDGYVCQDPYCEECIYREEIDRMTPIALRKASVLIQAFMSFWLYNRYSKRCKQ